MTVGKRIAAKRKAKNLTQASLAEVVGVTTPFISQIESGNRNPSYGLMLKIAHALDATVDSLLTQATGEMDDPSDRLLFSMVRTLEPDNKKKVIDYICSISGCKIYREFPAFSSAREYAQFLIGHYRIKDVPVDIRHIAENLGVRILHADTGGHEGVLIKTETPIILLNSECAHPERQTFTIAILLGHLVIPWHLKPLFYRHRHKKSLDHDKQLEMEAREFAGELMLPGLIIKRDFKAATPSIELLETLARDKYKCSMTALAHKYVEYYGSKAVYLTSEKTAITRPYAVGFPFKLVDTVKEGSFAFSFAANPPAEKETKKGIVDGSIWFEDAAGVEVTEESMIDPHFGVTVTLLQVQGTKRGR